MSDYIKREDAIRQIVKTSAQNELDIPAIGTVIYILSEMDSADVLENVRKPIPGYEGLYEVDECGRVFSSKSGKQKKQTLTDKGYKTVSLYKDGKYKNMKVHRAVAMAFIDNPNNYPVVNHKDEDKTNNFVENLEWCTQRDNLVYGTARNRASEKLRGRERPESFRAVMREKIKAYQNSSKGNGKPVVCLETGVKYTSICDAASKLGISEGTIRQSCKRNTVKGRNGMTFRYCGADMRPISALSENVEIASNLKRGES